VRQHIEGNLVRIDFLGDWLPLYGLVDLALQFFDRLGAGPRHRLVTRRENAGHPKSLVQRIQRHQRDGRRAVRVGDYPAVQFDIARIDFRDHQRHGVIHAESARIIHHHATGLDRDGSEFLRNAAAGAEQGDVDPFKCVFGEFLDRDGFTPERQSFAGRPRRRQQRQFTDRELTFLQGFDHLDADGSRRTDHGYMRFWTHTKER
jgi:hypothetical protein